MISPIFTSHLLTYLLMKALTQLEQNRFLTLESLG